MRIRPLDIAIICAGVAGGVALGAWLASAPEAQSLMAPAHARRDPGAPVTTSEHGVPRAAVQPAQHTPPPTDPIHVNAPGDPAVRTRSISPCLARSMAIPPSDLERWYGPDAPACARASTRPDDGALSRSWVSAALARLQRRSQDPEWSVEAQPPRPESAPPPVPGGPAASAVRIRNAWTAGFHRGLTSRRWHHHPPPGSDG